jgi:hypothetical protein
MTRHATLVVCALAGLGLACGAPPADGSLVINEVVSENDGAAIDEIGETDDYIELANPSQSVARLDAFVLRDESGRVHVLPRVFVQPGQSVVLWADESPEQGALHLPFKIDNDGERIELLARSGEVVDTVQVPALALNESYSRAPHATGAFERCRFATPGHNNGARCEPPAPPAIDGESPFSPFAWPSPWPPINGPLVLSELALRPAPSIEVLNASEDTVELSRFALRLSPQMPGEPWPTLSQGVALAWPEDAATLAPGERVLIEVPDEALEVLEARDELEGVATIFEGQSRRVIDRIEFMHWPEGAALTRMPDATGRPRFCRTQTLGEPNESCDEVEARDVGDRVRNLYAEHDFDALAVGDTSSTAPGVKFVVDMLAGDVVHFLSGQRWPLHYTFIRERIDHDPELDRCDPVQSAEFNAGWRAFSEVNYSRSEGRRYLLGTLEHHPGTDLWTVAYTLGDQISAAQMLHGFFTVMAHVREPGRFVLRPSEPRQTELMRSLDGRVPIVTMNAPFEGIEFQALTEGVGFGVLTFVPAAELGAAALGRDVIVVTDDVPNDIPLVGGLITEALQTPLAHVNILSKNRGTPNMALRGARQDAAIEPLLGELVRLEVKAGGFSVERADPEEADAFFQARQPTGPRIVPRLDTSVRGVQPLADRSLLDLPSIGAKAAQLAELARVNGSLCGGAVPTPAQPFAIPVVHSIEHFEASGAATLLREHEADPAFRSDPAARAAALEEVQHLIRDTPVEPELLAEVKAAIDERFGDIRVRMRSSSNTEDLPTFNGAGLYTSLSVALGDPDRLVDDGMRTVWASLFSLRAYDEREVAHIDQSAVAMGILVHPAFLSERANSVAISRNLLDPTRADMHYFNVQRGEASVANPAPGVSTEQLTRRLFPFPGSPEIEYQSRSTFSPEAPVMSLDEVRLASCYLRSIHAHFRAKLDPARENRWFAVDIELKLIGDARQLLIKQARPYSFGQADVPVDCREF